jgi:ubiquinone/menaquinone biosynthesis C-methylase UbiE
MSSDSTTRFSSRVTDYVSSRPSYPPAVVHLLQDRFKLPQNAHILDLGSGTGILSRLLLRELTGSDLKVTGLEPNKEMREAGDDILAEDIKKGRFTSMNATAESISLPDASVDLIVAGQAFHWFDVAKTRAECMRVLKQNTGGVALIWNDRRGVNGAWSAAVGEDVSRIDYSRLDSPVTSAYELLLVKRSKDYQQVDHHRTVDRAALDTFFGPKGFEVKSYENP